MKIVFTLLSVSLCFSLSPVLSLLFSFHFTSSSSLSFLQLNTINYDLHLRIIQTLRLHLSRATPLRKTLTVNHYLRIKYFQQVCLLGNVHNPVLGTNLQAFQVHRDLLAGLSDELRTCVYKDMEEGLDLIMDVVGQASQDTIRRFMKFCYSRDYLYASGTEKNSNCPSKDKDAIEALPLLLTHAKLYVFANMFNIISLKELSRSKIIALTPSFRVGG